MGHYAFIKGLGKCRTAAIFSAMFVLGSVTACDFSDPTDGFSGVWESSDGSRTYAVAYFKDSKIPRSKKNEELTVYRVLGSAEPNPIRLSYSPTTATMTLDFKAVSPNPVTLELKSKDDTEVCGEGQVDKRAFKLCYGKEKMELTVKDSIGHLQDHIKLNKGIQFHEPLSSVVTLDEAMGRARFNSYESRLEADKVYIAQQQIYEARARLLPRLSLRSVANLAVIAMNGLAPVNGFMAVDIMDSYFPAIYPSNWYNFKSAKHQSVAEGFTYRALQANLMFATQSLYYSLNKDRAVLKALENRIDNMKKAWAEAKMQYGLGILQDAQVEIIKKNLDKHENDYAVLKELVQTEETTFATQLAFNSIPNSNWSLEGMIAPDFSDLLSATDQKIYNYAKKHSFELGALGEMKRAMHDKYKAAKLSFIAPGSIIEFDFGYAARVRTAAAQEHTIDIQIEQLDNQLQKRSKDIISRYETEISKYRSLETTLESQMAALVEIRSPEHFRIENILEMERANDGMFDIQVKMIENIHNIALIKAAQDRLMVKGTYEALR